MKRGYQILVAVTALATYGLIVLGGVVRVTGSGLGCPDWPSCHGQWIPPMDTAAIIEYSHRFVAALDTALIVATVAATWLLRRSDRRLLIAAGLVPVLLVIQIALGAITVVLELPPEVVLVHLLTALLILAMLVWAAVTAGEETRAAPPQLRTLTARRRSALRWAQVTCGAALVLALLGAAVRATGATWACAGFPQCNGQLLPYGTGYLVDLHLTHRLAAYGFTLLLAVTLVKTWRAAGPLRSLRVAALLAAAATLFQIAVGAGAVVSGVPAVLRGLHVAGAAAVWGSVVLLMSLLGRWERTARRTWGDEAPIPAAPAAATAAGPLSPAQTVRAYLSLTKPGIISLLLVTTLAAMMIAYRGLPPLPLVLFTLLGGALSAGAANTFNCYIDRDIDVLMTRTAKRPLVSGVIKPGQALAFGLTLAILSVLVLGLLVNWLAAALSMCGLLYYVLVYTCWLKRSTPNNIVIGGAAGAIPPLVGWAAVSGELSLLAVYLFAVIFFWTPPHFWALALLVRREYERARVPMLPIARGEPETRRQVLVYSAVLVLLTLAILVFRQVGIFYAVAAMTLGGLFMYYALRLFREATPQAARGLFRYSILYLALLFTALVIDQWKG